MSRPLRSALSASERARYPGSPAPHIAISREERDLAHPPKSAFGRRRLRATDARIYRAALICRTRSMFRRPWIFVPTPVWLFVGAHLRRQMRVIWQPLRETLLM